MKKEGKTIRHLIIEAEKKALGGREDRLRAKFQAGRGWKFQRRSVHQQLQLGAFIPESIRNSRGIPTMHTEAACASARSRSCSARNGSWRTYYDAVLVVARSSKRRCRRRWLDAWRAAALPQRKPEYGDFMFPKLFGRIAQIYIDKYGAKEADLATVPGKITRMRN